jgi:hypothetical protein
VAQSRISASPSLDALTSNSICLLFVRSLVGSDANLRGSENGYRVATEASTILNLAISRPSIAVCRKARRVMTNHNTGVGGSAGVHPIIDVVSARFG